MRFLKTRRFGDKMLRAGRRWSNALIARRFGPIAETAFALAHDLEFLQTFIHRRLQRTKTEDYENDTVVTGTMVWLPDHVEVAFGGEGERQHKARQPYEIDGKYSRLRPRGSYP